MFPSLHISCSTAPAHHTCAVHQGCWVCARGRMRVILLLLRPTPPHTRPLCLRAAAARLCTGAAYTLLGNGYCRDADGNRPPIYIHDTAFATLAGCQGLCSDLGPPCVGFNYVVASTGLHAGACTVYVPQLPNKGQGERVGGGLLDGWRWNAGTSKTDTLTKVLFAIRVECYAKAIKATATPSPAIPTTTVAAPPTTGYGTLLWIIRPMLLTLPGSCTVAWALRRPLTEKPQFNSVAHAPDLVHR